MSLGLINKWQFARVARKAALFRSMKRSALSRLMDDSNIVTFKINDVVVRQGEQDQSVYIVLSGRVRVMQASVERQTETIVAELGPGEVFGEMAILESQPRSATVVTVEGTSCLKVPGHVFLAALSASSNS